VALGLFPVTGPSGLSMCGRSLRSTASSSLAAGLCGHPLKRQAALVHKYRRKKTKKNQYISIGDEKFVSKPLTAKSPDEGSPIHLGMQQLTTTQG